MIQTQTPPATKPVRCSKETIPFDTSVTRSLEDETLATLNLIGTFEGSIADLDRIELTFLSRVLATVSDVRLTVSATFYANGQKSALVEAIIAHATKKGKKIICDNLNDWRGVTHLFRQHKT
jgi:hypothetical protein